MPPLADTVALPVLLPKQSTFTWDVSTALSALPGWVMVTLTAAVQPLASVTITP